MNDFDFFKEISTLKKRAQSLKERNFKLKVEMLPYRVWIWSLMIIAIIVSYNY